MDALLENGTKSPNFTYLCFCDVTLRYSIGGQFMASEAAFDSYNAKWLIPLHVVTLLCQSPGQWY